MHELHLTGKWFLEKIRSGQKTDEGRLYDEKRQKIKIGDNIKIICDDEFVIKKVKALRLFPTFRKALQERMNTMLPGYTDIDKGENVYREFFSVEKEKEYGVVIIELE